MTATIRCTNVGHVAEISFANPPLNYANVTLLSGLADAFEAADANPDIRAILLISEGRAFCAGADLASPGGIGEGADPLWDFYAQALRIYACQTPIVAAIQGAAVGAGLGLAVAADFRVASTEAKFAGNFTKLGFHPGFGLTVTLPRLIGAQRAHLMYMTSRRVRAEDAHAWGLADMLVAPEALLGAARALAAEIAENAPLALRATRATMRAGLQDAVAAALKHEHAVQMSLRQTRDYQEGVAAVFERRAPHFTGT